MSTNICSYKDCMVRRLPCSSTAFFAFPNDEKRRSIWIRNSGNPALEKLLPNKWRFLCENHFNACDIRVQFNRKILHRYAVPRPHESTQLIMDKQKTAPASQQKEHEKEEENKAQTKEDLENYIVEYIEYESEEEEEGIAKEAEVVGTTNSLRNTDESDNLKIITNSIPLSPNTTYAMSQDKQHIEINENGPNYECLPDSQMQSEGFRREELASDTHFALSLVHYFQCLNPEKKSIAKLRILSYLTNLEFGGNGCQNCFNCHNCKFDLK